MNIKTVNKKAGAVILLGSMIISLCGCSMFSKKDVVAAAKEVAENIVDFDADKLLDLSTLNKKGEKAEDLRKGLNGDYLDENSKKFCNAVKKTMSYEIDEKSFSIQGNEATIDIIFEMADYELILKKDYKDIDELVSAVRNCFFYENSKSVSYKLAYFINCSLRKIKVFEHDIAAVCKIVECIKKSSV